MSCAETVRVSEETEKAQEALASLLLLTTWETDYIGNLIL